MAIGILGYSFLLFLVSALARHLPGCKSWSDWFSDIAFPPFEEKLQRVFERQISDGAQNT